MLRGFRLVATTAILFWPALSFGQSSSSAHETRVFGAYSVNADYVANVPFLVVFNQPVSPFFSHGSGPYGFEASIERGLRGHLGIKASVSRYVDPIRRTASYCQPPSICAIHLPSEFHASAMYFTAGPVLTARESRRTSLFVHALVGAVRSSSTFTLSGSNVEYVTNPTSLPDTLIVIAGEPFGQPNNVSYSDHFSDIGLAATLGGGVDVRLSHRLQFRMSMDWDPTFLSRPKATTNTPIAVVPSEQGTQSHVRVSLGVVWRPGK